MKLLSLLIWFIFFLMNFSSALTWDNQDSKKEEKTKEDIIMDFWKQKKRNLVNSIYEQTNIASLMDLNDAANQISEISSKLENLNMNYKNIEKQKESTDQKYNTVLADVKKIITTLNEKNENLKKKLLSIQIISKELDNMKKQIENIEDNIYISKKQIEKNIWLLYKINNDYYTSLNWLDDIKLLFKSKNIAESLSQEDILKMISLKTQDLLWKLEESKKIKNKFLKKLYSKRVEYTNVVNEYKTEIEVLTEKRKFLIDLLTMLKKNKEDVDAVYNRLYNKKTTLEEQQISLTNSIMWTWSMWTWSLEAKKIDLSAILQHTTKNDGDKFFSWPIKNWFEISAEFQDPWYYNRFWWEHDWLDLKVKQWSEIYSSAAWYVYHVVDNDTDYYNYIVIAHNYWYISIYWHVYKSFVKEWDIVKRWELIASSWWERGTRWAWKLSTWPHLHFEVYKNWQLIDPLSVLDLSVYKNKNYIPQKWNLKYVKDSLTRKIDLDWLNYFSEHLTHKERQELFLRRAAPWFNNLTWWTLMWKKMWIDPDFAICLGYAESWLWHNTSSLNNVWNVWNNDRWDRVDKRTPQDGINSIYYALNNKYLSKHHTIDQLSRWWNKDSHIFSSSSYNWQKNVTKCLSIIKAHPIDEYFPFRDISTVEKKNLANIQIKK